MRCSVVSHYMCVHLFTEWYYMLLSITWIACDYTNAWSVFWREFSIIIVHDDVIKRKHFPRQWSFVRGIHQWPLNSPHNAQWRGALMFFLICAWIKGWVNNREAGDLIRHRTLFNIAMYLYFLHARLLSWLDAIQYQNKTRVCCPFKHITFYYEINHKHCLLADIS